MGILAVVACELPIIVSLVGMAGLSSTFSDFALPSPMALLGGLTSILFFLIVVSVLICRIACKVRS